MLESEAKYKWCPMYRTDGNGDNRLAEAGDDNCLGSGCACWIDTGYDDKAGEDTGRCGLAR